MYDGILVPLDGSPFAEQALPLAVAMARAADMPLELLRVHQAHPVGYAQDTMLTGLDLDLRAREAASEYLDRIAVKVAGESALAVRTALLDDRSVANAICRQAEESRVALIAMTTHGRTGILRTVRGSVADAVVRHAPVPVLMWRPSEPPMPAPARFTHFLAPLDGSSYAESVLPHVAALASMLGARVTLLRVVPSIRSLPEPAPSVPFSAYTGFGYAAAVLDQPATDLLVQHAHEYLERIARRMRDEYPALEIDLRALAHDDPAGMIVQFATLVGADIVAMTTHARPERRLLVGSTVDGVMHQRAGATLLVRPPAAMEAP